MMEQFNVLIVDDNVEMCNTISDILLEKSYSVSIVNNGYKAIELVEKNNFDIILLDILMPGINGVITFKKIKQINPLAKVIMMTAYPLEVLIDIALDEGVFGIIYKPFNMDRFLKIIDILCKEHLALIIDGDTIFSNTFKDVLNRLNFKIISCHNALNSLDYLKKFSIDLIFMDIKMPKVKYREIYQLIKKIDYEIPVVCITESRVEMKRSVVEAFKNHVHGYLIKPFKMEDVFRIIRAFYSFELMQIN